MSILGILQAITQSDGLVGKVIEGTKDLLEHAIQQDQQERLVKAQVRAKVAEQRELDARQELKESEQESARLGARVHELTKSKKKLQDKLAAAEEKAFKFEKIHNDRVNQEGRDKMVTELDENPYPEPVVPASFRFCSTPTDWRELKPRQVIRAVPTPAHALWAATADYLLLDLGSDEHGEYLRVRRLDGEPEHAMQITPGYYTFFVLEPVQTEETMEEDEEETPYGKAQPVQDLTTLMPDTKLWVQLSAEGTNKNTGLTPGFHYLHSRYDPSKGFLCLLTLNKRIEVQVNPELVDVYLEKPEEDLNTEEQEEDENVSPR